MYFRDAAIFDGLSKRQFFVSILLIHICGINSRPYERRKYDRKKNEKGIP